ncbi:short coiled-coil protein [Pseudophryne corroboree]|uniref:short coiled-coil protein n=2 Tax=Neobatrachia TaxID=8416 RepID=UPI00308135B3
MSPVLETRIEVYCLRSALVTFSSWKARTDSPARWCRRGGSSRGADITVYVFSVYIIFAADSTRAWTDFSALQLCFTKQEPSSTMMNSDMDALELENQVELEEKTRLINQVLELQHTLEDLSARVDAVKEENLKLKSENQVLGQYIENLMSASSVFQTTDTKSKRK